MANILILNLGGTSSLFSLGRLIKSISINSPDAKIGLLVLSEELNATGLIPGVNEIFTIKSEDIIEYFKSELFSDALAVNSLLETLAPIESKTWDTILNFGGDEVGKYLSSYFALKYPNTTFLGNRYNQQNNSIPAGKWHLLSDALKDYPHFPLNDLEIAHLSMGTPIDLFTRPKEKDLGDIKVGIQIPKLTDDKNLPFKTLVEFIDILKTDLHYFPILLFDSNDEYAEKINRYFDNELEIISTNYLTLTKILPLLDTLITSGDAFKNLAQQMGIPVIEAIGDREHLDSSWAPGERDLTIVSKVRIKGEDIYNVLTRQFDLIDPETNLFTTLKDLIGARPYQLKGYRKNLSILMSRYLIGKSYLNISDPEILRELSNSFSKELPEWLITEKEILCEVSRIILNSLRLLKQLTKGPDKVSEFVASINELLKFSSSGHLVSIPLLDFKYQTDLIPSKTDLTLFEDLIFTLKEGVQNTLLALKDLEHAIWDKKKVSLIAKSLKNRPAHLT